MDKNILYRKVLHSECFGEYYLDIVRPPAAKVVLVHYPLNSNWLITRLTRAYMGEYVDNPIYGPEEVEGAFDDIAKTKLQTPLEMVELVWLFRDVTRAFTHQLVRYRIGTSFIQESMRFLGMKKVFKVLVTHEAASERPWTSEVEDPAKMNWNNLKEYTAGVEEAIKTYVSLLDRNVPSEDARGILPTNILTNIYFKCSLLNLKNIIPQRMCCQAQQGEWQYILKTMRDLIEEKMGSRVSELLKAPYELGQDCGYRASFDRPCKWKNGGERDKTV